MNYNISLIPGDGIGPEIVAEAKKVLDKICEKYGHTFSYSEVLLGGASIDVHGVPLTDEAIATAKASDAVLMGSIGGDAKTSPWYKLEPSKRPEAGLLAIQIVDQYRNPLEQMRLAADNYNRYGHYMAALKNYHHVVYQMTHDYDSEMTRQFKADTWHNMGMAFLRLHNIKCAAECMKRAFELVKTQDFLAPYMYVLELLGDHEKILTLIRQEDIPTDISDAVLNRYKEVEHLCEHSEENRKIQDGLTLGNGQTTAKYWDFVRDYLDRQKKNYDLT